MTSNSSQLSAATALVQLLTEHPELSEHMTWSITRSGPVLCGFIHDGGMSVLANCAEFLGGNVQADESTYLRDDQEIRTHVLASTWRDVRVQVLLPLPVAAEEQVAA